MQAKRVIRWSAVLAAAGGPEEVGERGHLVESVGAREQITLGIVDEENVVSLGRLSCDEKERLTLDAYLPTDSHKNWQSTTNSHDIVLTAHRDRVIVLVIRGDPWRSVPSVLKNSISG